jgi:hypothetical protein
LADVATARMPRGAPASATFVGDGMIDGVAHDPLLAFSRFDAMDRGWRSGAACRGAGIDTEAFFGSTRMVTPPAEIAELCGGCAVRGACLEFALVTGAKGIWGGLTERQRDALQSRRGAA